MLDWCSAIRAQGVTLYTVALNVTNSAAITLLQTCAGSAANALNIDTSQLEVALTTIASGLVGSKLHMRR